MKINSIIDLVKDLDTSRQTKNLNKLLIRILLHLQVEFSSYYVEDGDYWKIDNIVLGYNFKKDFIKGIKGMRLYFSVQNALTITGYKGLDPEVGGSLLTPGTDDRNKYPTTRSYTFGVNLNF